MHDAFLDNLQQNFEIVKLYLYDLEINPCIDCGKCKEKSLCFFNDDMNLIYEKIREANYITFSFPLYFSSLPSTLKALVDRCQLLWEEMKRGQYPGNKKQYYAYFITAGSSYKNMFLPSEIILKHFANSLKIACLAESSLKCNNLDSDDGQEEYSKKLLELKKLTSFK